MAKDKYIYLPRLGLPGRVCVVAESQYVLVLFYFFG